MKTKSEVKIEHTEQEYADWQRACKDGVTDKSFEEYLPIMREGAKREGKAG